MVFSDSDVCLNLHLDVSRRFRHKLAKVRNFKVWKVHRFDRELTLMISYSDCGSENCNSFVMSFGMCAKFGFIPS